MKLLHRLMSVLAAMTVATATMASAPDYPFRDTTLTPEQRVADLIGRMTLDEKISVLSGYNDFYIHPVERLGVESLKMADGPLGVASWGLFGRATAYPASLMLAASWDRNLADATGQSFARDWRSRGLQIMLAPGVNIYRSPRGARNFEYFGEDPLLTSEMAGAFVASVQRGGVLPVVKHFAGNDQEYDRYNVSTEADERTLREVYMLPFENLIRQHGLQAVMSGYNLLGGVHCSENPWLTDVLRGEWGFDGMYMSDWGATHSTFDAFKAGMDMEMGSNYFFIADSIKPLLERGLITEAEIDAKVSHIFLPCFRVGFFDPGSRASGYPQFSTSSARAALEAARGGIVMLENNNGTLPVEPAAVKRIAVIGPTSSPSTVSDRRFNNAGIVYGGGGSSKVNPWYVRSDLQGIIDAYPEAEVTWTEGVSNRLRRDAYARSVFDSLNVSYYSSLADTCAAPLATAKADRIDMGDYRLLHQGVGFNPDSVAAVWTGTIIPERTDTLVLFAEGQGACSVEVNGRVVVDAMGGSSFYAADAEVPVVKGVPVSIRVAYDSRRSLPMEAHAGYVYKSDIDFGEARRMASEADAVVLCLGFDGSIEFEGRDRPFELPYGQVELAEAVIDANPRTVVVLHGGGGADLSRLAGRMPALLHAFYPGQEGGTALADVISGCVNPSGKLPFTMELHAQDSPSWGNYDDDRAERRVYYREGIFTGYRGFDRNGTKPLYPFGHGLSYTTFAYSDLSARVARQLPEPQVEVAFTVTNTGSRAGAEVAQVYVADAECSLPRPVKELKGFDKVNLAPGESRRIAVTLGPDAFRFFDPSTHSWRIEPGKFSIMAGPSSAELPLKAGVMLK